MQNKANAFMELLKIMEDLRLQCPWDKKQTIHSLRNLTLEEAYELSEAIVTEDMKGIREELGDLLLHIVFYARIAEEQSLFHIGDIIQTLNEKLIRRHPHIYGDVQVENEEDVKKNWEQIKMDEGKKSVLGGVPNSLPALIKAFRMQDKTSQVGFDWKDKEGVRTKLNEELNELDEAISRENNQDEIESEFGDVLFTMVNYARFIGVDPETALEKTNRKFKRRFEYIENHSAKMITEMNQDEMDFLWEKAKMSENDVNTGGLGD